MAQLKANVKAALHRYSLFGKIAEVAEKRSKTFEVEAVEAAGRLKRLWEERKRLLSEPHSQRQLEDNGQLLFLAERHLKRTRAKRDFWGKRFVWARERHEQWGNILRRRALKLRRWLRIHRTYGAGGWAPGRFWVRQRVDQGQDIEIKLNRRLRAAGDGEVIGWAHDGAFPSGFGDPYAVIRVDTGDFAGLELYLGHANADVPPVGRKFKEGDHLSRCNNSLHPGLGWCEIGLWPVGPMGNGERIAHLFKDVRA